MVDIAAIAGLISSLKSAGEIANAMLGIKDAALIQGKVVELQGVIIAAQQSAMTSNLSQAELINRVRELEAELMQMKAWEAEKQRYELTELPPGVFVYSLKPGMAEGQPMHRLCATCYDQGKRSILHSSDKRQGTTRLKCHGCGNEYVTGHFVAPPPAPRRGIV